MTEARVPASRNAVASSRRSMAQILLALAALVALAVAGSALGARDLTVTLAAPAVVEDNSTFALNLSSYNTGSGAGSSVEIQLYLDGNATAAPHNVGNLANGEFGNASESFTLACGVYFFNATVDPSDGVPETDESNNNASLTVLVVPYINATSNLSGSLGAYNLTLNASASHGCAPLNFTWMIGGETFYGPLVTYFPLAGDLTVDLTVRSAANQTFSNSLSLDFTIPNAAPTVELPATLSIQTLDHTLLSANAMDADGYIAAYIIDFGDGNTTTVLSDLPQYQYHRSGTFTLTVTVFDNLGANATANLTVQVANRPPVADVEFTFWVADAGAEVPFDASGSQDPEGGPLTFSWNFGDGTTGTGAKPTHPYANPGTYTVTVRVMDSAGASQDATISVQVEAGAPPTGSFPWIWILILVLLTALVLFWLMRRRKDGEEQADKANAQSQPQNSDEAKAGEGSSSKPPSP